MFQKTRTHGPVRGRQGPVRRVTNSTGAKFPLDGKVHLPMGGVEAVSFISRNGADFRGDFRKEQDEILEIKARQCWQ